MNESERTIIVLANGFPLNIQSKGVQAFFSNLDDLHEDVDIFLMPMDSLERDHRKALATNNMEFRSHSIFSKISFVVKHPFANESNKLFDIFSASGIKFLEFLHILSKQKMAFSKEQIKVKRNNIIISVQRILHILIEKQVKTNKNQN